MKVSTIDIFVVHIKHLIKKPKTKNDGDNLSSYLNIIIIYTKLLFHHYVYNYVLYIIPVVLYAVNSIHTIYLYKVEVHTDCAYLIRCRYLHNYNIINCLLPYILFYINIHSNSFLLMTIH